MKTSEECICRKRHYVFTSYLTQIVINKGDIFPYIWNMNDHTVIFEVDGKIHEEIYDELEFLKYWRIVTIRIKNEKRARDKEGSSLKKWHQDYYERNKEKILAQHKIKYEEKKLLKNNNLSESNL